MTTTPNHSPRQDTPVDFLLIHYTAGGGTAASTARYMVEAGNSAHAIVDRNGDDVRPVDLHRAAWHAGDHNKAHTRGSRLPTKEQLEHARKTGELIPIGEVPYVRRGVNRRSYGVELVNRGWAQAEGLGAFKGRHRNPASRDDDWQPYTPMQLAKTRAIAVEWKALTDTLIYTAGHEDCVHADTLGDDWTTEELERKTGAKLDPGPAFDWSIFEGVLVRVMYDFAAHGWRVCA